MRRALVAVLGCASCTAAPDRPPIARITASPTAILARDDFATAVVLDGAASASLVDPEATLAYTWQFLEDEARTEQGLGSPMLTVRFRGERPPRVVLTVTDDAGLSGSVTLPIQLTVAP